MSPADIAATHPDKPAYIMAETGDTVTFAELEATANQGAQLFRSLGLQRGDHIAILLRPSTIFKSAGQPNAQAFTSPPSAGVCSSRKDYIVNNCEARVFITSHARRWCSPWWVKCLWLNNATCSTAPSTVLPAGKTPSPPCPISHC